jgi:hypothetical protein
MPRDDQNQMYNALQATLTVNNLFANLKKAIQGPDVGKEGE